MFGGKLRAEDWFNIKSQLTYYMHSSHCDAIHLLCKERVDDELPEDVIYN